MNKEIKIKIWHILIATVLCMVVFVCWDIFNINTFEDEYNKEKEHDSQQSWSILVERHLAQHHSSIIYGWYEEEYGIFHDDIPTYPWADIIASLVERKDSVHFINDEHCWRCGSKLLHMYFDSPSWTWQKGYGSAGPMVICPNCPRKVRFERWVMN